MDEERERAKRQFDDSDEESSDNEEEEEEDWKKPSAYSLLMGSLKKNSKQQDFYKKIQLEQEGIEGKVESEDEQEEEEELEDEELEDEEELENEEEIEDEDDDMDEDEEADDAEPADPDAADPYQEEDDEEEEFVYMGSDAEAEEEDSTGDLFEERFADQQPGSFDEAIATVDQKKWIPQTFKDDVLHDVAAFTTTKNEAIKDMPMIENLEDVNVKQRVAKSWAKANKDIFKKGKSCS